jgi:ribosome-binding ATPase YchF (GTP1/OBG family)
MGIMKVQDPNLQLIRKYIPTDRVVPAEVFLKFNYPRCTISHFALTCSLIRNIFRTFRVCQNHPTFYASKLCSCPQVRIIDIAGLVRGASEGAGLGNKFLSHIRQVDALVNTIAFLLINQIHVVRCFHDDNVTHVDGSVDPVRDADIINTELVLADLQTVERSMQKKR